jgi:hypothetical protein
MENEAYFKTQNYNQNNFKATPSKQYIKNRIIENLSDSKYPARNKFPNFDVQQVMKISNSENKNFTSSNLEYPNQINYKKNSIDSKNLFKQNYMNYGHINNNNNNIQNNFTNMNQMNNYNLMKKQFENFNIKNETAENFAKLNELNNNQKLMMNNQNDFKQYHNLNFDYPYSMMMIQNNQKMNKLNFENMAKNEENLLSKSKIKQIPKSDSKKIKKPFIEREGDWVCFQCKNLNFSFRVSCNRCQISKEENETLKLKQNVNDNKLSL